MEQSTTVIQCKRTFSHGIENVFEAFLNPAQIKEWFGPNEFSIGKVAVTPVAGGDLEIEMITPKGHSIWVKGTYTEIIPNAKIIYTFIYEPDWHNLGESLVTIHFSNKNSETEVVLTHTVYKMINAEGRSKGWETGFDKMEVLLERISKNSQ